MALDSTLNATPEETPPAELVSGEGQPEVVPLVDPVTLDEQPADPYAAALLRERLGYIRRGDAKRVAGVEAELERIGYVPVEKAEPPKGKRERATK